jgi:trk system potassium uptake protein TrkA
MKRFIIVGLGNFGATAARVLQEMGRDVTAVDVDQAKVQKAAAYLRRVAGGDGTDREVLQSLGASEADAGIVSTGDDVTASALTALALKDCGVTQIFVKVISDVHARILEKVGVAETIFPERESAQLLAKRIVSRNILNYVDLGFGLSAQEMAVPQAWVGRSLRQLELPKRYNLTVIAVHDWLSGTTRPVPDPDVTLKDSDALFVAGRDSELARVAKLT